MVSPDEGGVKRAVRMANKLCVSTATIYKERNAPNEISRMVLMGNVENKICVIVDDIIDTAGTACKAAAVLKEHGASKILSFKCLNIARKYRPRKPAPPATNIFLPANSLISGGKSSIILSRSPSRIMSLKLIC